jgi:hypothetical protein
MYIPKLNEEEARFLVLRFLAGAQRRQGSIDEIRASVRATREMGKSDLKPNPNSSNAPFWHQIVQNATDRYVVDHGYVEVVLPPPNKILRLTDIGAQAAEPYLRLFERHPAVDTALFFDSTILDDLFTRNRTKLPFPKASTMSEFVKSASYARTIRPDLEKQGVAETLLGGLERKFSTLEGPTSEEGAFRLRQIRAWRAVREDYDPVPAQFRPVTPESADS